MFVHLHMLIAFCIYFCALFIIGYFAYKKSKQSGDFILGKRSLNYWITALSAHASDMSGWLFMGFPAVIYANGLIECWTAIALTIGMYLNWHFIAPKLRRMTENYKSLTLPSFFQTRFNDQSGILRIVSVIFCLLYFTFYLSAGLTVFGHLFESMFGVYFNIGALFGIFVVFYVLLGGFVSIALIDFFQGIFLMCMILLVPLVALIKLGGLGEIITVAHAKNISLSLFPASKTGFLAMLSAASWGFGYFGLPQILTKFMGIDNPEKISHAKRVGISWQILSITGAVSVGLIGIAFFKDGLVNNEHIFIEMVKSLFPEFFAGIILCAISAAAINVMGGQALVSASVLAEDFYKKYFFRSENKNISQDIINKRVTLVSRLCVILMCFISYIVVIYGPHNTIYKLTNYAWSGLGCSFGPLVIVSLYSRINNRWAALSGILSGGIVAGVWPYFCESFPAMIVGFFTSFVAIYLTNFFMRDKV
jgi:sodium/proline symporter